MFCLCASCHFWSHKNPIFFVEFIREYLGPLDYEMLKNKAVTIKKWKLLEMEEYLKSLKNVGA